jgi:hypothetical protein
VWCGHTAQTWPTSHWEVNICSLNACPQCYLKLGHGHLPTNPFQFIIHITWCYEAWAIDSIIEKKKQINTNQSYGITNSIMKFMKSRRHKIYVCLYFVFQKPPKAKPTGDWSPVELQNVTATTYPHCWQGSVTHLTENLLHSNLLSVTWQTSSNWVLPCWVLETTQKLHMNLLQSLSLRNCSLFQ